jgi:hypothetical protein
MTKYKYFEVTTTTIIKAPAVKQARKQLSPFIQPYILKRITAIEKAKEQS